jgi:hypothetical protein
MKKYLGLLSLVSMVILISACISSESILTRNRTPSEGSEETLAAQLTELANRIDANQTAQLATQTIIVQDAYQTALVEMTEYAALTEMAQLAAEEGAAASSQPGLEVDQTPSPNQTLLATLPAPVLPGTPVPSTPACEQAALVSDVSVPDWSNLERDQPFTKTWRIKNSGDCAWEENTALVFDSGEVMDGPGELPLGYRVEPGEEAVISVDLLAPQKPGKYTGYWKLRSQNGAAFGTGPEGKNPLWVSINVETPNNIKMDAAQFICAAAWYTASGDLPCPNPKPGTNGSMFKDGAPQVEGGYQDDEPALVMIPNDGAGGTISARFPAIQVEKGDHFQSVIGCLEGNPACDITFELGYQLGEGKLQPLGSWRQVYDGVFEKISIDLSALAGQMVELVLTVRSNNGTAIDNAGFWLAPVVIR